jgi:pyruvate dehydrogenase E1 component beta subunit
MVQRCLDVAQDLEAEGISCEVVDVRYIWPLDMKTIAESVAKTGRLAVVHEAVEFTGWGGEVAAWVAEHAFMDLDAPISRVGAARVPIPFGSPLEDEVIPTAERIEESLRSLARY